MILKVEKGTSLNFERYLVLLQKFPERERERERFRECLPNFVSYPYKRFG
jgi:hypothetical protein